MKYDIVFVIESNFQKKVIEYLINNYFNKKHFLIIQKVKTGFKTSEGESYQIDFNHIKGILKSSVYLKNVPHISCDVLINTVFTGVNCRVFEALIDYKKLYLIDDGIGTPVILKNPNYYKNFPRERLKMFLTNILIFLKRGVKLKNTRTLINRIDSYYTVYPKKNNFSKEIEIDLLKINYRLIHKTGFIGQPLVEYNMVKPEYYKNTLIRIISKYGELNYYPDPSEKLIYNLNINGLIIVDKNEALETHLEKEGLPKTMFTFTSSALLNLRISNHNFTGNYIKIPNGGPIRQYYYDIFKDHNLVEYKIDEVQSLNK